MTNANECHYSWLCFCTFELNYIYKAHLNRSKGFPRYYKAKKKRRRGLVL